MSEIGPVVWLAGTVPGSPLGKGGVVHESRELVPGVLVCARELLGVLVALCLTRLGGQEQVLLVLRFGLESVVPCDVRLGLLLADRGVVAVAFTLVFLSARLAVAPGTFPEILPLSGPVGWAAWA